MNLNYESSFSDLINNEFDLSQFMGSQEKKILYKAISESNISDNDKSVEYRYNDNFFRSDNFISHHDGMHILFSGCSESEGVGDIIENSWTNILYKKISKDVKCSGFFNLSRSGWGWSKIVINALIYFEKHGYPDFYFVMLPNHLRMHKFFKEGVKNDSGEIIGNWKYLQYYPQGYYNSKKNISLNSNSEHLADEKEYKENFIHFLNSWKLFNKICKDNNVRLIFSTWDTMDHDFIDSVNIFDSFIKMPLKSKEFDDFVVQYYKDKKKSKHDISKRDGHHGILFHNFWADKFYDVYKMEIDNV
jgi:hypothetical protein